MSMTFLALYLVAFLWGGACAEPAGPAERIQRPGTRSLAVSFDSSIPVGYRSAISAAVATWAEHLDIQPVLASSPRGQNGLLFRMVVGDHGDGFPFTLNGLRISHVVSTPGDRSSPEIHFSATVEWKTDGGDPDVYSVALHEIGHAFGLHHSSNPASIMYPWYGRGRGILDSELPATSGLAGPIKLNSPSAGEKRVPVLPLLAGNNPAQF